jgi:hypothetical protein
MPGLRLGLGLLEVSKSWHSSLVCSLTRREWMGSIAQQDKLALGPGFQPFHVQQLPHLD